MLEKFIRIHHESKNQTKDLSEEEKVQAFLEAIRERQKKLKPRKFSDKKVRIK
jgi:hypothetical protein